MNFDRIQKNYNDNLWTKEMVKLSVEKGVITKSQFFEITGEEYDEVGVV